MSGKSTLLILALAMLSTAAAAQQTPDEMRFLFTGDIMMSRQVKAELHQRQDSPWADFSGLFRSANLVGGTSKAQSATR